jgi:hypothetical protein
MRAATKARMMTERMISIMAEAGLAGGLSAARTLRQPSLSVAASPVTAKGGTAKSEERPYLVYCRIISAAPGYWAISCSRSPIWKSA